MSSKRILQIYLLALDKAREEHMEAIIEIDREKERLAGQDTSDVGMVRKRPLPESGNIERSGESIISRIERAIPQMLHQYTLEDLLKNINDDGGKPLVNDDTFASIHRKFKGKLFTVIRKGNRKQKSLFRKIQSEGG